MIFLPYNFAKEATGVNEGVNQERGVHEFLETRDPTQERGEGNP